MIDTIKRIREKRTQILYCSAMVLAFGISGCTTSNTSLLEGVANSSGTLALNPVTDPQTAVTVSHPASPAASATDIAAPATVKAAEAATVPTVPALQPDTATESIAAAQQTAQPVSAAEKQIEKAKPSSLAALFGSRSNPVNPAIEAAEAVTQPATLATPAPSTPAPTSTLPAPTAPASIAPVTDRTSQSAGAAARLFAPNKTTTQATAKQQAVMTASAATSQNKARDYNFTLPGVRANGGLEIKHRNSVYDDSDIDSDEDDFGAPLILASAGGMARLAPNGLRTQHNEVQVACLRPQLVSMLKNLERHYRKPVVVTSGFRSPTHNRKVRGAKRSLHMSCSAADIQIAGVSKWEIARHVRTLPGRGGVGTYCHTESIHVDVGPERDWNWRCRRS